MHLTFICCRPFYSLGFVSSPVQVASTVINLFQPWSTCFNLGQPFSTSFSLKKSFPFKLKLARQLEFWRKQSIAHLLRIPSQEKTKYSYLHELCTLVKIAFIYITCVIPIPVLWKARYSSFYWPSCWNKEVMELYYCEQLVRIPVRV